jgi:hypothetical protein
MKIKHALNTAALAITLAFAGVAQASQQGDQYTNTASSFSGALMDLGGKSINDVPQPFALVNVSVYEMVNVNDARQTFLAYCFQPDVDKNSVNYTANYWADTTLVSNQVRALYETSYASTIGSADRQLSFQLALWELKADDGSLAYSATGAQYFSQTPTGEFIDSHVGVAAEMLDNAAKLKTLNNTYLYTVFTSSGSQTLIGAAPVPEADTWAMLGAGLGLVGFMGRRKSKKSEKFAA